MRKRMLSVLVIAPLVLALAPRGATLPAQGPVPKPKGGPLAVVRLAPLDDLIANGRFLAKALGQEELAKQIEGMVKARTGPKGLEGLDTKKPIGFYGSVAAKLAESPAVFLLPIADQKGFLGLLETLDIKAERGKDGLYTANVEGSPFPVLFRFANGYLYGTLKVSDNSDRALAPAALPLPETVLKGSSSEMLSITLNLDRLPGPVKDAVRGGADLFLGNLKDQELPMETPAIKALRETLVDQLGGALDMLLRDAGAAKFRIDMDRKAGDLGLAVSLSGQPGSEMSKALAALTARRGVAAALAAPDAALSGLLSAGLPDKLRKAAGPVVDDLVKKAVDEEKDAGKKAILEDVLNSLKPTVKAGEVDVGFALRGPGKDGKYTLVLGVGVRDGAAIEAAIKKVAAKLPAAERKVFAFDVGKVGEVAIHRFTPKNADPNTRELFGDGPAYFALRGDALLLAGGEDAEGALKEALKRPSSPTTLAQFDVSVARFAKVIGRDRKDAEAIARKVFVVPGSDRVRFRVEGGRSLELRVNIKAAVLDFAGQLDRASREEKGN